MWSSKLVNSLKALGHECSIESEFPATEMAQVAIVNLGDPDVGILIKLLKAHEVKVIAHAGHKEKDLLEIGKEHNVDHLATNSELTFKIESILFKLS
jgi:hypothetical protein